MRAFKFRLQPVLDLREQEKETLQQRYHQARERCRNRREDLQKQQETKKTCLYELEVGEKKRINPQEREMQWIYIELLNAEMDEVREDIYRLEKIARERFRELVEKLREEKSLEKLKENLAQAHKLEQERANQKEIDEMGQQLFHLKRGERF